ncbi:MAG: MATE family efflux transporter [Lachnospiraceae bacterium]|jgi:putative MATE family efflux protein|nr:MATE family efflux transporter [Lachnospiraceae bacterium]
MNKDLTVGKPETVLWKFCVPLFGSIIFQQLYNIADSFVAGKFIGENALAAVGNSYEITLIFIAFAFGCNIGCSVVVSQLYGAKKYKDMKVAISTSMIASGILCGILMLAGLIGCTALIRLIQTPDSIFADSKLYLYIYIGGFPFLLFYNVSTGIFSALGDSKTPFTFLACSSTLNILADILFVAAFHMGVAGVAWATFLCQGISCILAVIVVKRRLAAIHIEGKLPLFSAELFRKIAKIAVPSILQQSFISIGNIIIQGVINGCGVGVTAGYSAAVKLNNLVITSLTTLGNGVSNYTAQNLGAGSWYRVKEGFKAAVKIVWLLCAPIIILYLLANESLIKIFMDEPSQLALMSGTQFLNIVAPFYAVISVKLVADGILRGAGLMKQFMLATFTDLILRVILAVTFSKQWGYLGIWCAWPIGWCIATTVSLWFYRNGPWKTKEVQSNID